MVRISAADLVPHDSLSQRSSYLVMMSLEYTRLNDALQEIRLLDLHPGRERDEVRFSLRHVPLLYPGFVQRDRLTQDNLRKTLPPGWIAEEAPQYHYRFIFENTKEDTTWEHPDPACDPSLWQGLEELPLQGFHPVFEALSYTWGSENDPETVYIDYGCPTQSPGTAVVRHTVTLVRHNLAAALRALRYHDKVRTLWVDAVCIDQSNDVERNSQVKRMSQIYRLAQGVVIWLGPSKPSTLLAIDALRHLGSQLEVSRTQTRYRSPGATEPEWFRATTTLPYSVETWQAINELLSYPLL